MHHNPLRSRIIGVILSLILTMVAYFIITQPADLHLTNKEAVIAVVVLGILQFIVQSVFFISLWREDGPPWNLGVFASTLSMVIIIIAFSIWIMDHLNYNMMP